MKKSMSFTLIKGSTSNKKKEGKEGIRKKAKKNKRKLFYLYICKKIKVKKVFFYWI